MTDAALETAATSSFLFAEPQLFVSDVAAACSFYEEKLGFSVAFAYGEPPFYAQVCRGGARLNLRFLAEPAIDPALQEREQLLSATIALDVAEPLFREYGRKGVDFHQELRSEPWGAQTFVVSDPDGNLILFAASLPT
jgi:catechol 2,3-dioxygenase-like lactoylglutathione lyase family enzyme